MKQEINIETIKHPLLILYRGNEGGWLLSWERERYKSYSDVFDIDDVNHIFSSIVFISENVNEVNYIASFKRGGMVATRKIRVSFDIVIKLDVPLTIDFINKNSSRAMEDHVETAFNSGNNFYYLNKYQTKTFISCLLQLNDDNLQKIKRILSTKQKIIISNKNCITSTERDVLGLIFRINDLDNEKDKLNTWNIEDISTPEFLKGLQSLNTREDQIIIKDSRIFGDWQEIKNDVHSICTFSNNKKCVTIIYANRTKIESNIGVDLIYFDHINRSYIFVQYKRLAEENKNYVYRPKSDKNLDKELELMEELETKLTNNKRDYRFNNQVFYFKFCKERQEIYSNELSKGFYMPKDYFLLSSRLLKESGHSVVISYDTITRYLNNTVFIELIQSGLIGTRIDDAELISNIIKKSLSNDKSLILASSS